DANAAGHGWFVDPTPQDASEFAAGLTDSPAAGRVDLLTVLTHEMGHILGLDDDSATDPVTGSVMADVLPLGVRRINLEGLLPEAPTAAKSLEPLPVAETVTGSSGGFSPELSADAGAILSARRLI